MVRQPVPSEPVSDLFSLFYRENSGKNVFLGRNRRLMIGIIDVISIR